MASAPSATVRRRERQHRGTAGSSEKHAMLVPTKGTTKVFLAALIAQELHQLAAGYQQKKNLLVAKKFFLRDGKKSSATLHQRLQMKASPVSGAPFLLKTPLKAMPTEEDDDINPQLFITREQFVNKNAKPPSACDLGTNPSKDDCMAVSGRECMWVSLNSAGIRNAKSHCLPCEIDNNKIPCWNVGAKINGDTVEECQMQCPHQAQVRQPEYACVEESGFLTKSQCFDLGNKSGSKCMYLNYKKQDAFGADTLSICAPCFVSGIGTWDCPKTGKFGDVVSCDSQCAAPPPPLPPHAPPPPKDPPESPGLKTTTLNNGVNQDPELQKVTMVDAPFPVTPAPPPSNEELIAAAQAARDAAALASGTTPAPPLPFYVPVVMYRKPEDYAQQTPILDR